MTMRHCLNNPCLNNFIVTENRKPLVQSSYLISEYNSTFRIIIPRMDPCICREENGAFIKTMNNNLQQVKFLAMKVGNQNSPGFTEVRWDSKISYIFKYVGMLWRLRQPASYRSLYTLPRVSNCKNRSCHFQSIREFIGDSIYKFLENKREPQASRKIGNIFFYWN